MQPNITTVKQEESFKKMVDAGALNLEVLKNEGQRPTLEYLRLLAAERLEEQKKVRIRFYVWINRTHLGNYRYIMTWKNPVTRKSCG